MAVLQWAGIISSSEAVTSDDREDLSFLISLTMESPYALRWWGVEVSRMIRAESLQFQDVGCGGITSKTSWG